MVMEQLGRLDQTDSRQTLLRNRAIPITASITTAAQAYVATKDCTLQERIPCEPIIPMHSTTGLNSTLANQSGQTEQIRS
eukprot:529857-Amphidinium_carterae.2